MKITKDNIPEDWKPWIKIARSYTHMKEAVNKGKNKEEKLLIGLCLSAAKWITGNDEDLNICGKCGLCFYTRMYNKIDCGACPLDHPIYNCCELASKGLSMHLYAKKLKELSR
jgi:hypothetical protein